MGRLEAEATRGPWRSHPGGEGSYVPCVYSASGEEVFRQIPARGTSGVADAALAAAMRSALPGLIADARVMQDMASEGDARAKLAALRADLARVVGECTVDGGAFGPVTREIPPEVIQVLLEKHK